MVLLPLVLQLWVAKKKKKRQRENNKNKRKNMDSVEMWGRVNKHNKTFKIIKNIKMGIRIDSSKSVSTEHLLCIRQYPKR